MALRLLTITLLGLTLLGCGGSGGGSARFPYLGAWSGGFGNLSVPAEGTISPMDVEADGTLTFDIAVGVPDGWHYGHGEGTIGADGRVFAVIQYDDDTDSTLKGRLERNEEWHLVGDLTLGAGAYFFSASFIIREGH